MEIIKGVFYSCILVLMLVVGISSNVFANSYTYKLDKEFYYQVWETTDNTYTNLKNSVAPLLSGSSSSTYPYQAVVSYSPPSSPTDPSYGLSFLCPLNSEDYICRYVGFDFTYSPGYTYNLLFGKYRRSGYYGTTTYKHYELPAGDTCHATYVSEHFNSATKKLTVTVDNDLNPLQTVNGNPIKYNGVELHKAASLPPALNQILRKNYYTKYFVYLKLNTSSYTSYKDLYVLPQQLEKDPATGKIKIYGYPRFYIFDPLGTFESGLDDADYWFDGDYLYYDGQEYPSWDGYPYNDSFVEILYNNNKFDLPPGVNDTNISSMDYYPYVILKPGQNNLTFDLTPIYNSLEKAGLFDTWTAKIYLIPVDGKCDLNGDGETVGFFEVTPTAYYPPFQINGSDLIPDLVDTGTKIVGVDAMHRPGHCHWDKLSHKIKYSDGTTIPLPTPTHNITLIKKSNGVLISKETIPLSSILIALRSANLRNFRNATSASKFINKTVDIMDSLNVQQIANYIPAKHQTNVQINITDIPAEYQHNLTLYVVLPKTEVTSLSQIKGVSNPNKFFYVDGDPIIGWNLNSSTSSASVSYNISGSTSGGTVIITQTPILFNGNTVIINYRTGGCSPGEIELWELDSLDNSKVYAPGSGRNISVCISHPNATLYSTPTGHYIHILNYTNGGNATLTGYPIPTPQPVYVSTDDTSLWWDIKLQQNQPSPQYACIGSYTDADNTRLGDCGFTTNRIWIKLSQDTTPPVTVANVPYLSHTIRVILSATDDLSGVQATYYCVDSTDTCIPTTLYTGPYVTVTCPTNSFCTKYIRFYSKDNAGNIEPIKSEELDISEIGNACQPDCTLVPKPNRYYKYCDGLNGCHFYDNTTKNACHLKIRGSWVPYNSTHEIKCPDGPFRKTIFTNLPFKITSSTSCSQIIKRTFPVKINGQMVDLNLFFCIP